MILIVYNYIKNVFLDPHPLISSSSSSHSLITTNIDFDPSKPRTLVFTGPLEKIPKDLVPHVNFI